MHRSDVQRYARQILVRDVGRAGQELWLASEVAARGEGAAVDAAVELLQAAGVRVQREHLGPAEIAGRRLGAAAFADRRAACEGCVEAFLAAPAIASAELGAAQFELGALVASEVLLALLDPQRQPVAMTVSPAAQVDPRRAGCACRW